MLIVVSPAKSLDYETPLTTKKFSEPRLTAEIGELVSVMQEKSPDDLASMMSISPQLAELNFERYQGWEPDFTPENSRPAVLAFAGDVYMGLDAPNSFSERDFTHAQKTLRILSGLYGVLRPLDRMQPYRLEMGSKLKTDRGDDLYSFWGDRITDSLNADLAESPGSPALINLASNEYFGAVNENRLEGRLISPAFLDSKDGKDPKIISFFAKRARGLMAGWIIQNRIKSVKALDEFDVDGYEYDEARSTSGRPVFVRVH